MTPPYNNLTHILELPELPPQLTYNFFEEFAGDDPALHIQVNTETHTLLQVGIPYPNLYIILLLNDNPDHDFYLRPTFGPTKEVPNNDAVDLRRNTITDIHNAIQRTTDVFTYLHGTP